MAYVTGSATNMPQIISALTSALGSNGWTVSGDIVSKGDCYIKITDMTTYIAFTAGLGVALGDLVTPAPAPVYFISVLSSEPVVLPVTYHIHIHGNEVYLIGNWSIDKFQIIGFGQSPITGMPGTGVWVAGTAYTSNDGGGNFNWSAGSNAGNYYAGSNNSARTGLFITSGGNGATSAGCYLHHGLTGWSGLDSSMVKTHAGCRDLTYYDNPATNPLGQTTLVPIQPWLGRGSSKVSLVGDLVHARYCRMDNLEPGDVITLGSDRWRVYPVYKKSSTNRNGSTTTSGTFGYAIKYDGP